MLCMSAAAAQVPAGAEQYRSMMVRSAYRIHGPGAPIALLAGQIHQESAWDTNATSWVGASGLAQFMPATAKDMAKLHPADCAPAVPTSPRWAFNCRDLYMRSLRLQIKPMGSGITEAAEWAFALRSYNGGSGWIARDRRACVDYAGCPLCDPDDWQQVAGFNAGRSKAAFRENTEYPIRIFKAQIRYASWGRTIKQSDELR